MAEVESGRKKATSWEFFTRYVAFLEELQQQAAAAVQTYREQTHDLQACIDEETARLNAEWYERRRREVAEARRQETVAIAAITESVWTYNVDIGLGPWYARTFIIYLLYRDDRGVLHAIGDDRPGSNPHLTAAQVEAAAWAERARSPGTSVEFSKHTASALKQWHGSDDPVEAWRALIGQLTSLDPAAFRGPGMNNLPAYGFIDYGPSSDYGSASDYGSYGSPSI
ncbi:hypothetical protein ACTMTJ_20470 [Phytohabitans sp. LJ34]|uniref:hypothetical protein n=1 Tax=Phytohabitans sp. LJ34 TaxID=3452217 RepID=UPI003F89D2F7